MKDIFVSVNIRLKVPLKTAYDFASEPENAPHWYKNISLAKRLDTGDLKEGSRTRFQANFMGKTMDYVYEITQLVPSKKLVMKSTEGPFPMETTYEWEKLNESETRMVLSNKGQIKGFSILFSPFMPWMMKRATRADLIRLKTVLEGKFPIGV